MKLVKLSLVAAMAAGVFATTASAIPLEEAIKDIDVSGYTRLRYTTDKKKSLNDNKKVSDGKWNFKGILTLKTKIDDNFFTVIGLRYNDTDGSESKESIGKASGKIDVNQAYFGYNIGGTTIQVGRQTIGAFFTNDMFGDGIKVINTDIQGLTLAALWMDSLEDDPDFLTSGVPGKDTKLAINRNLYGVAAIGSYDPVSFQLWYAALEDVANLFVVEAALNFDVSDDVNLGLKGQYGFADVDGNYKDVGVKDSDIWAVQASAAFFGVDASAGYVDFSTDKGALSLSSMEDDGKFIIAGEELIDYALYAGKNDYWFVTAGYTIPNTGVRIGADYLDGKGEGVAGSNKDMSEVVGRIEYAHNKKLKFQTWYSRVKDDRKADGYKNDRFRFEAKYSF